MKKNIFTLSTLAVAALALFSCAKVETEIETPKESKGVPFEIVAGSIDTKTTNTNKTINWSENDAIALFHAVAGGTEYGSNDRFSITSANLASNKFTGTLADGALDPAKSYDWYAFYPYISQIASPNNTDGGYVTIGSASKTTAQVQAGYNSMAHLSGQYFPLYGKGAGIPAATTPSLNLKPALSIIKVHVTNGETDPLTVTSISIKAAEEIVGQFYISFHGATPGFTAKSNGTSSVAKLNVTGGTSLEKNEDAYFYIAVKPFTAANGSKLTIVVNDLSKTVTMGSDFTFPAGEITNLNFNFERPDYDQLVQSKLGISGSGYQDWSNVSGGYSSAKYAGRSAPNDNNYIQLNATSPAGIVSTTSGGKVTKVVIDWTSTTTDGRFVTIYGKNTPYSGSADLYSDGTRGTELGTIVKGTSTELTIGGYYEYVGILANNAIYMDEIDVYWGAAKTKIAAPTGVSASEGPDGTITVIWTDSVDIVEKYIVTCTGKDNIEVAPDTETAAFTGLQNGTYTITIMAVPYDTENYTNSVITTISDVTVAHGIALPVYTLDGTHLEGNSNAGYASGHDITQNSIDWNVTCNANINPWRVGGDKTTTNANRALYSKTAIANNIKTIKLQSGTTNLTVNSLTVTVHSSAGDAASGANPIATFSYDDSADIVSKTITMNKVGDTSWANKYYRIVYNVTHGGTSSNRYVQFFKAEFYD